MSKIKEILKKKFPIANQHDIEQASREIKFLIDDIFETYGYLANVKGAINELFEEVN